MTTNELIAEAKNGSKGALTVLLLNNKGIVTAVVQRFIFEREQYEDIIQTIFAKAIKTIKQFNGACRFSTWLYRISVNECVEYIRRKTRAKKYFSPAADNFAAFPDCNSPDAIAQISDQELRNDIQLSLQALPLDQKTAFSLYYFGNYSGKEVAEALNITEANFFMKLKASRDAMKKKLIERGWHL